MKRITILDSTLGAGGASAGGYMTPWEKLRIAGELEQLGVDGIHLGWPASADDLDSLRAVASHLSRTVVAAEALPEEEDIRRVADALAGAAHPRLRMAIPSSDLLLAQAGISADDVVAFLLERTSVAKRFVADVELTLEDAVRAELPFLCRLVEAALEAGTATVTLADSVGYGVPSDFARMLSAIFASVHGIDGATIGVRCADDLGLAVANSLAAAQQGARQIECALNGMGPRAGIAALEEVAMALRVRPDLGSLQTGVKTERLHPASQLVAHITGVRPPANKAVVGEHALSQDASVAPILTPEMVGARERRIVLGRHSTREALVRRLRELGYELEADRVEGAYEMFQMLAASKKTVLDEDLLAIYYQGTLDDAPKRFRLENLHVVCGRRPARATVRVREEEGATAEATAEGDGPIDATLAALQEVIPWEVRLESFAVQAATPGTDAVAEAHLHVRVGGDVFSGRAASTDIVDAAARAFLNAIDKAAHTRHLEARALERVEYWGV